VGPGGNAVLRLGTGCLTQRLLTSTAAGGCASPAGGNDPTLGFLQKPGPCLGKAARTGHRRSRGRGTHVIGTGAGTCAQCRLWGGAEAGAAFRGSPSCTPGAGLSASPRLGAAGSPCNTGWVCRGPQTELSHPIGSGGGLISPFLFLLAGPTAALLPAADNSSA